MIETTYKDISLDSVFKRLEDFINLKRSEAKEKKNSFGLRFDFDPYAIWEKGIGPVWQAIADLGDFCTIEYGLSISEAARNLLDRLEHPELHPNDSND